MKNEQNEQNTQTAQTVQTTQNMPGRSGPSARERFIQTEILPRLGVLGTGPRAEAVLEYMMARFMVVRHPRWGYAWAVDPGTRNWDHAWEMAIEHAVEAGL